MEDYKNFTDALKKIFELQKTKSNDEIIGSIQMLSSVGNISGVSISELVSFILVCESENDKV